MYKSTNYCFFITTLVFVYSLIFSQTLSAEQLYSYRSDSGSLTFTSRRPEGKNFKVVDPKTPKYSIIFHRGLGYNWSSKPKPTSYDSLILELAKKYKVEAAVVKAVIHIESAFNARAVSSSGARGLMQLIPATARRFGVTDSFHPIDNMTGGIKYLSWLFERFNGNLRHVLAGYNAGEGAVDQYGGIPPYRETQDYVKKVIKMADLYRDNFTGDGAGKQIFSDNRTTSAHVVETNNSQRRVGGAFSRYSTARARFKS